MIVMSGELSREDLERIARAAIEERLDSMKFTLKIDMGRGGSAGKRGVAFKRTPEQRKEAWWPMIVNAIGKMLYVPPPTYPTFAKIRSYINVPTRLKDEELYDLFSLYMNELNQQGKLSIQRIGDDKPFYDFTPSSGVDRDQWDQ